MRKHWGARAWTRPWTTGERWSEASQRSGEPGRQEPSGRWRNESASIGKMWVAIDKQGHPSKWMALRACSVPKAVYG
jgi:hypothetical protein